MGETRRRTIEKAIDRSSRDVNSHLNKHGVESRHKMPDINSFSMAGKSFRNNTLKLKIDKSLLIKEMRVTLNKHEKSVNLKLCS